MVIKIILLKIIVIALEEIESVFKNQKSDGFFIENTTNASLDYFQSMYCFASIGILFLTILGADYSKNKKML